MCSRRRNLPEAIFLPIGILGRNRDDPHVILLQPLIYMNWKISTTSKCFTGISHIHYPTICGKKIKYGAKDIYYLVQSINNIHSKQNHRSWTTFDPLNTKCLLVKIFSKCFSSILNICNADSASLSNSWPALFSPGDSSLEQNSSQGTQLVAQAAHLDLTDCLSGNM